MAVLPRFQLVCLCLSLLSLLSYSIFFPLLHRLSHSISRGIRNYQYEWLFVGSLSCILAHLEKEKA